ncbi:type I restriction enzyme HsdR N-terminal domain-containing protein [Aquitalea aquatilis]|uniref:type I restriction enzyme HsdR N-terminal domain-containing protein n=1 Tax=Aquitalea aquatilis TaxID=1537400 RepID=UPI0010BD712D|nr:type I restriction enzyme HsdR N-terminal domain-containing protein [Aquitalea aquatilis]
MIDYETASRNLVKITSDYNELGVKNEAETRFHFIDSFLTQCLGWDKSDIDLERYLSGERSDYELGCPIAIILEAKRDAVVFDIPVRKRGEMIVPIRQLMDLGQEAKAAIEQVQGYCARRGVRYAAICNGPQLISFVATRTDGKPPLEGRAFVIDGFSQMRSEFSTIFNLLSPLATASNKLLSYLDANGIAGIPEKISTRLPNHPSFRYQNESQSSLRMIAELLLEDVARTDDLEQRFYRECYCDSGPLAQDALVSKNLLKTRYAALFHPSEEAPVVVPVKSKDKSASSEILAESLSRRPIILLGDVGVGKTSFIKNLMLVEAEEEFKKSIYIYLDLGVNAFLHGGLESYVRSEVERQLYEKYEIDINSEKFIYSVYGNDIKRFRTGLYGRLAESNPALYEEKLLDYLSGKLESSEEHLGLVVKHIQKSTSKQIIVIFDNVDQRELEIQQRAFIVSQGVAEHWGAIVFLSVRPNTFHQSKRAGALSAYPNKVFYIMPPRPEMVLEKRLIFALNVAEGRLPIESISSVSLNLEGVSTFLKALLYALRKNPAVAEFLSNITGGNVRSMIDFVTKFTGSPNVDSDKIIELFGSSGDYLIPVHEFSKAALLGDYSHYDSHSSWAMNIFDVRFPDAREHFLCSLILAYLNYDSSHRNREGFVTVKRIQQEMQSHGFSIEQTENALIRMTNKKLIETTQRITFEENAGVEHIEDFTDAFRVTTIGAYHLIRWSGTFAYLDAMVFDTPIFDAEVAKRCGLNIESFDIKHRFLRTTNFRDYLSHMWDASAIFVPYFNWKSLADAGEPTFDSVQSFISGNRTNFASGKGKSSRRR